MKKFKLLPAMLMLVLCVGVLAIGVFAITPTKNTISGTITINASNPEMIISVYPLNSEGVRQTALYENVSVRSGININLGNTMTFDLSKVNTKDELKDYTIDYEIEVQNPTATKMAVYFTTEDKGENVAKGDVKKIAELETVDGNKSLVKANMTGYTTLPAKSTNNGECSAILSFELLDFPQGETSVVLNDTKNEINFIYFNIDEYDTKLEENVNGVALVTNNHSVSIVGELVNTQNIATVTLNSTNTTWAPTIKFSEEKYSFKYESEDAVRYISNVEYIVPTATIQFTVTNNEDYPISANFSTLKELENREDITVVALGNPYIPANGNGEISVQFSYNRANSEEALTVLPEDISEFAYQIEIEEVEEITNEDIIAMIDYDETGIADGRYHYFIEYGTNPYKTDKKLRWFIWAKVNNKGESIDLAEDDITGSAKGEIQAKPNTYCFISEYALDEVPWENEQLNAGAYGDYEGYSAIVNAYGEDLIQAEGYENSKLCDYLNGKTVREGYVKKTLIEDDENSIYHYVYFSSGNSINMYERYGLNSDPIFGLISNRQKGIIINDKFWCADETNFPEFEEDVHFRLEDGEPTSIISYNGTCVTDANNVYNDDDPYAPEECYAYRPCFQIAIGV